ncbi:DUF2892 domain-containing protein [Mameliella sp. AT18]|uniref:YgaP family membrane protein n=1 Tax=Mameliella sp. AT18 TaxID=3028385 RepID=UPI000841022D|nr:DUF2892 domain-containing protein [Mameliella sp. AT18]MDD9728741.1 DUF2892 domain-containing protein [Mameliella sp. AT18]ODM45695.1 hypothetical protein A9320_09425 [Ruegeria sp. PBVC088]
MFEKNMGSADRAIRAVLGVLLVIAFFAWLSGTWAWIALIVGVVMLATAAMGFCPPYSLLGIKTCARK